MGNWFWVVACRIRTLEEKMILVFKILACKCENNANGEPNRKGLVHVSNQQVMIMRELLHEKCLRVHFAFPTMSRNKQTAENFTIQSSTFRIFFVAQLPAENGYRQIYLIELVRYIGHLLFSIRNLISKMTKNLFETELKFN